MLHTVCALNVNIWANKYPTSTSQQQHHPVQIHTANIQHRKITGSLYRGRDPGTSSIKSKQNQTLQIRPSDFSKHPAEFFADLRYEPELFFSFSPVGNEMGHSWPEVSEKELRCTPEHLLCTVPWRQLPVYSLLLLSTWKGQVQRTARCSVVTFSKRNRQRYLLILTLF